VPTAIWKSRSAHCDLEVAVEVRQCPLGSGARGGGPAVAHWDLELAVELRLCPLGSGLRGGGGGWEEAEAEVEAGEVEAEEEEENSSDKIQQPSPGRWGINTRTAMIRIGIIAKWGTTSRYLLDMHPIS